MTVPAATFDHRDAGTAEAAWTTALAGLPRLSLPDLPVLVLAAHPDDETLGAGGLIHAAAAAGLPVSVLVATDGEASHPDSPTHRPGQLARVRRREVAAAVTELAPSAERHFLGLPDGGLDSCRDRLAAELAARLCRPSLVVTPWHGDGHPDHAACAAAGAALAPGHLLWQYPIWAWHWADPAAAAPRGAARLELSTGDRSAKRAAVAAHASQCRPLSAEPGDEAVLSAGMLAHFGRGFETFVPVPARDHRDHPAGDPGYFDALYSRSDDPWGLAGRFYEVRKRELLLAALPRPRFRSAVEPGCAGGLLTGALAGRCDAVLACDATTRAVELARRRLRGQPHVRVEQRRIPQQWPRGSFDLIVLSEVGYYCADLAALAERVEQTLAPDGVLLACHWRHPAPDHPHRASTVHTALGAGLRTVAHHVEEDFLLDVWSRDGRSVARQTGILR